MLFRHSFFVPLCFSLWHEFLVNTFTLVLVTWQHGWRGMNTWAVLNIDAYCTCCSYFELSIHTPNLRFLSPWKWTMAVSSCTSVIRLYCVVVLLHARVHDKWKQGSESLTHFQSQQSLVTEVHESELHVICFATHLTARYPSAACTGQCDVLVLACNSPAWHVVTQGLSAGRAWNAGTTWTARAPRSPRGPRPYWSQWLTGEKHLKENVYSSICVLAVWPKGLVLAESFHSTGGLSSAVISNIR